MSIIDGLNDVELCRIDIKKLNTRIFLLFLPDLALLML